jgi:hypothetical protein
MEPEVFKDLLAPPPISYFSRDRWHLEGRTGLASGFVRESS